MMQGMPQGAPDQAPAQEGGGASKLIQSIQSQMKQLGALLEKSGVGGEGALQEYSSLIDGFEAFIEKLSGGEAAEAKQPAGVSSPEAGANPNARPVG